MANLDAPAGFRAVRNSKGTAPRIEPYIGAAGNLFEGAIMFLKDTGEVDIYSGTTLGRQAIVGALAAPLATAATDRTVFIYDDPDQEYEVQVDDNSVSLITDLIGANFAAINPTTGNATLLQSKAEIDGSSATTVNNSTTITPFRGLRFGQAPDDDPTLANNDIVVKINPNNHVFGGGTGDIGVL